MRLTETLTLNTEFGSYKVTAEYYFYIEYGYGADADGNRGVDMDCVEDIVIISVKSPRGINLIKRLPEKTLTKLEDWFNDNCDPHEAQDDAAVDYGDEKYHELRDEEV